MADLKEKVEDEARRVARGDDVDTPVAVHTGVFLVVAAFVGVIAGVVLLIYFLVR
jgi:hypothetical protein